MRRLVPFAVLGILLLGRDPAGAQVGPGYAAAAQSTAYLAAHSCLPPFSIPYTGTMLIIVTAVDEPLFSLQSLDVYTDPLVVPYLTQFALERSPLPDVPTFLFNPTAANVPNIPTVDASLNYVAPVFPLGVAWAGYCGGLVEDIPITIFAGVNNYYESGFSPPNILVPFEPGTSYEMSYTLFPTDPYDPYPFTVVVMTPADSIGATLNVTPI